jgi:site-specific DNA-methyltransferase (adenine-specific)
MSLPTPYYRDESVTLYCADCRDVLPKLPKASLVFTDPPYKMERLGGAGFAHAAAFYREALDGLTDFQFDDFAPILADSSDQIVAFHSRDQILQWGNFCREKFGFYDLHVWYKVDAIPFTNNTWKSDLEYMALGWRSKNHQAVPQALKSKAFVSPINTDDSHPCAKPIGLPCKYITVLTTKGESVHDPFCGTGTTLVAAKLLGRTAVGIEIEEKYCRIAAERLRQGVLNIHD